MGRLIAYVANRRDRLEHALYQERGVLGHEAVPRGALSWGIAFYQGDEVLHKKRPLAEGEIADWKDVAQGVASDCAIMHLRQPITGDFSTENTQPFRMRSWSFAHSGAIARFDLIRDKLFKQIPDFLQRNIRGTTDSEHFFHLILAHLHDLGQLERAQPESQHVVASIDHAVRSISQLAREAGAPAPTLSCLLTDGNSMYALSLGEPLIYAQRQGLHDPLPNFEKSKEIPIRYVLIASTREVVPPDYRSIEHGSILVVDRNLTAHSSTLRPSA